ncbi:uncharacterized protein LOC143151423 [Ptiloglossa arizonensis]|uniref:uncharacterized protein LOC143151423 n=1 Tax=Ptiloglossa arizonensis TaxID=3350558 RepID=UPI003FA10340
MVVGSGRFAIRARARIPKVEAKPVPAFSDLEGSPVNFAFEPRETRKRPDVRTPTGDKSREGGASCGGEVPDGSARPLVSRRVRAGVRACGRAGVRPYGGDGAGCRWGIGGAGPILSLLRTFLPLRWFAFNPRHDRRSRAQFAGRKRRRRVLVSFPFLVLGARVLSPFIGPSSIAFRVVRAWVRACVRACVRTCVRTCVRACVRACGRAGVRARGRARVWVACAHGARVRATEDANLGCASFRFTSSERHEDARRVAPRISGHRPLAFPASQSASQLTSQSASLPASQPASRPASPGRLRATINESDTTGEETRRPEAFTSASSRGYRGSRDRDTKKERLETVEETRGDGGGNGGGGGGGGGGSGGGASELSIILLARTKKTRGSRHERRTSPVA